MDLRPKDGKDSRQMDLMWWGLALYMLGFSMPQVVPGMLPLLSYSVGTVMLYVGLWKAVEWRLPQLTRTGCVLMGLMMAWHLWMLANSDVEAIVDPLRYLDPYSFTLYLYPLVLLVPLTRAVTSYFRIAYKLQYVAPLLSLIPIVTYCDHGIKQFIFEGFIFCSALVLLTYRYHSRRTVTWAIVCMVVGLLVSTITARRNLMMTCGLYSMAAGLIWFFRGNLSKETRFFAVLAAMAGIIIMGIVFVLGSSGIFSNIVNRAGDNTRDYVFLLFFWDILQTPLELIFGRGITGVYECAGVDDETGVETTRQCVENGFLQLILKGGIVYMLMYLTTLFYCIRRGLRSTNQLCLAAGVMLIVQVLDMVPFGLHAVNAKTYVIWMCVALLLNKEMWKKTDEEIEKEMFEAEMKLPEWK